MSKRGTCHLSRLCCVLLLVTALPCATAGPTRVASLNLCTDQLLLMLLPRERIVSVSHWSQDPDLSYMAAAARGLPRNSGRAEDVIALAPDLILASHYNNPRLVQRLRSLGYRLEQVPVPAALTDLPAYIRRFGRLVGTPERAEALARATERRLAALPGAAADAPLAVIYGANGVSAGAGTLLGSIVSAAGWRNLAAERGITGYGALPLEQLLLAEPELLVLEATTGDADSLARRERRHPVLTRYFPPARQLALDPRLTVCAGPMTVDAAVQLAEMR